MRLFYSLAAGIIVWSLIVLTYDLFQTDIEKPLPSWRLVYLPEENQLIIEHPIESIRIVYASMFGPGEPIMRVRQHWINRFEQDYSNALSADAQHALSASEEQKILGKALQHYTENREDILAVLEEAGGAVDIEKCRSALAAYSISIRTGESQCRPEYLQGLTAYIRQGKAPESRLVPRIDIEVETRWQGRWVLSANRPRFLTGSEVPDIIVGSKMELLALVEDDYLIPLNRPLNELPAPLDTADTYADPNRKWKDAFIPAMLEEGKYTFIKDTDRRDIIYIAPLWCNTNCIFYNKVLFEKAGITKVPRTWPEFVKTCKTLQAAGIAPLTADQHVYSDMWMNWLIFRIVGPEYWEAAISGGSGDLPANAVWNSAGFKDVFSAIMMMREQNWFKPGFRGLTWPAAQRGFAAGDAAMMICGSWLVQELGGYQDIETAGRFEIGCFSFPQWPRGREIDQLAVQVSVYGLAVCRQGRSTSHAIELVKYLSAFDYPDMVHQNAQISCMKDAEFPPDLAGIADDFRSAPVVYNRTPNIYARRYNASILIPSYNKFFMQEPDDSDYMTVDAFLDMMQKETEAYQQAGGEEGFE